MSFSVWRFLKQFINASGNIKESPALLTLGGGFMVYFTVSAIRQGEVNMSRTSISPLMIRYAEHPLFFCLVMLFALVFAGWLFWRAYQYWPENADKG